MNIKFVFGIKCIIHFFLVILIVENSSDLKTRSNFQFYLWKVFQRSSKERLFVDNVDNLKACKELAIQYRGLALNYSPKERFLTQRKELETFRGHYWLQPQLYFNCHVLQCPENDTFKTMINDTSFDYYSLYDTPMASSDYICLPEVGLFMLHSITETYQNASLRCKHSQNYCATLAHVASHKRTEALSRLIANYNKQQVKPKVYLAYIGLQYNSTWSDSLDFYNAEKENLKCFAYSAWEPGNPKLSSKFGNASCVALTLNRTWKTVECRHKLNFICEIWTSCGNKGRYL